MTNLTQLVRPLKFRVYTEEYDDALLFSVPYYATRLAGIGLPMTNIISTDAPTQHGATPLEALIEPRSFSLSLTMKNLWKGISAPVGQRGSRIELARLLNPGIGDLRFEVVFTNGDIFYLKNVYVETIFDATYGSNGDKSKDNITIRFVAYKPVWYGELHEESLTPSDDNDSVLPGWEFTRPYENHGTWISWPSFTFVGPTTGLRIAVQTSDILGAVKTDQGYVSLPTLASAGYFIHTDLPERGVYDAFDNRLSPTDAVYSTMFLDYSPRRKLHDQQDEPNYYSNFVNLEGTGCTLISTVTVSYRDMWLAI